MYKQTDRKIFTFDPFSYCKTVCLDPMKNPIDYKASCLESYETPHKKYMYCILYDFQAICERTKYICMNKIL